MKSTMKYIDWQDEWATGSSEIDKEHRAFIANVNAFLKSISDHSNPAEILIALQDLVDHANEDFELEELFLKQICYPDIDHHIGEHKQISLRIQDLLGKVTARSAFSEWFEIAHQVRELLTEHFLHEDNKYREYLRPHT